MRPGCHLHIGSSFGMLSDISCFCANVVGQKSEEPDSMANNCVQCISEPPLLNGENATPTSQFVIDMDWSTVCSLQSQAQHLLLVLISWALYCDTIENSYLWISWVHFERKLTPTHLGPPGGACQLTADELLLWSALGFKLDCSSVRKIVLMSHSSADRSGTHGELAHRYPHTCAWCLSPAWHFPLGLWMSSSRCGVAKVVLLMRGPALWMARQIVQIGTRFLMYER